MNPDETYSQVVNGKKYSVETSTLLASDAYWDGHNWERHGRNTFLYKTTKGNFFTLHMTCWQGEDTGIGVISTGSAKELWEQLPKKVVDYEEAFGEKPEDA